MQRCFLSSKEREENQFILLYPRMSLNCIRLWAGIFVATKLNFKRLSRPILFTCLKMAEDNAADETRNYSIVKDLKEFMDAENVKEIGSHAVWSVSSCKQGKVCYQILFLSFLRIR